MHLFSRMTKPLFVGSLLLAFGCSNAVSKPVVVVEDALDTASAERAVGEPLKNIQVQKFDKKSFENDPEWISGSSTVFADEGGVSVSRDGGAMQGLVAVSDPTKGQLTLKVDAKVGSADWVGIGFLSPSVPIAYGQHNWFYSGNPLFAILTSKGKVNILRNGAQDGVKNIIGSWTVKEFDASSVYTFEFQYDIDTKVAIVKINGDAIGTGIPVDDLNDSAIGFVGFRAQGPESTPGDTRVQNFSYTFVP
jgi:hypothetical protein